MALSEDGQDIDRGVEVNGRGAFGDVVVGGHGASLARMVGGEIPSDNSWSRVGERGDNVGCDGFAAAHSVDAFVGFRFDVNFLRGKAQRLGEGFAHLREMRTELWAFKNDNGIDVVDREVFFVKELAGVFEEVKAVRTFPLGIAIRKMRADIAEARGAEKRIAQGMSEDVAIGMPNGSLAERNHNSPDDQVAASGEAMQVVTNPAAKVHDLLGSDWR